jgi:hypothetical protein
MLHQGVHPSQVDLCCPCLFVRVLLVHVRVYLHTYAG